MATQYSRNSRRVYSNDIESVTSTGITVIQNGDLGALGTYVLSCQHDNAGCAGPESSITLSVNSIVGDLQWTYITFKLTLTGSASCWSFCKSGYGGTSANNITSWNSSIDRVFKCQNSFENPAYTLKMNACDNAADNFFHGSNDTGTKIIWMTRRRNDLSLPAGPSAGRSCNSTGAGSVTTISDIFVLI